MDKEIIIGIGMQKSGTSSLIKALKILGYKTKQFVPEIISNHWSFGSEAAKENQKFNLNELSLDVLNEFNALSDNPLCFKEVYEFIDQNYKNAKFIMTIRPKDEWVKSAMRHCDQAMYHIIEEYRVSNYKNYNPNSDILQTSDNLGIISYLYGVPFAKLNKEVFEKKYMTHTKEVREYFSEKENYLELKIDENMDWKELCDFLSKPVPKRGFPHSHTYKPYYIKWGLKHGKKFIPKGIRKILKKHIFWKYIE